MPRGNVEASGVNSASWGLTSDHSKVQGDDDDGDDGDHDDGDHDDGHDDHDDGHDPFLQTGNVPPGDFPFEELPGSTPVTNGDFDY